MPKQCPGLRRTSEAAGGASAPGKVLKPACCRAAVHFACCTRSLYDLWRRERALAHLPGPNHHPAKYFSQPAAGQLSTQHAAGRSAWDLWRRERALAHLPGPDHRGLFGGMAFINTKAVHRETARLVNQYGPLFKLRILVFHVRRAARLWD